ncbi:hypothetical protein KIPB_013249, partial [Kipferlia bialata]
GVKLVKIDAIVVLSYILAFLMGYLLYLGYSLDRTGQAYFADIGNDDIKYQFHVLMQQYTHFEAVFAVLNPLGLLLLCNLSLLWDKRPAWMRRDHATKRDTEGGAELFL